MAMSAEAIENDKKLGVGLYPVKKIYNDREFNIRKNLTALDVIELANDIAKNGLSVPIKIEPRREDTPAGFDYRIIYGHRRHTAYRVNEAELVPAILTENLSVEKAKAENFRENMHRKALTIVEEAEGVAYFISCGWGRDRIAEEFGQSPGWVQIRQMLHTMPEAIKEEAAAGMINQTQIRQLYSIKDKSKQIDVALQLKKAKQNSEKKQITDFIPQNLANNKRHQPRTEIQKLLGEVQKVRGNDFLTRCLAWASGEISNTDIYKELKRQADELGVEYTIPAEYVPE